jgi:hypothetical protein
MLGKACTMNKIYSSKNELPSQKPAASGHPSASSPEVNQQVNQRIIISICK